MKRSWETSQTPVRVFSTVQSTTAALSELRVVESAESSDQQANGSNVIYPALANKEILDFREANKEDKNEGKSTLPEPLLYQIPQDVLQQALDARASGETVHWSYHLYCNDKDVKKRPPIVHYCRKKEFVEQICQHFVNDELIGFDLEWKPNVSKGSPKQMVSLIQLANAERIALFHIALHREEDDLIAPTLKLILENPEIKKVGVAISGDCTRLRKTFGVKTKAMFELSHLHKLVQHFHEPKLINRQLVSLTTQMETHFNLPLEKEEVRESDWSRELRMEQIRYAANDAYASVRLFDEMNRKRLKLEPTPPLPHFAELKLPIRLTEDEVTTESDEDLQEDFDEDKVIDGEKLENGDKSFRAVVQPELEGTTKRKLRRRTTTEKKEIHEEGESEREEASPSPPAEVLLANEWVANYLTNRPTTSRKPPSAAPLRAYFLWQQQGMDVAEIAKALRTPPLAPSTVSTYIMQCVHQEELECDATRARTVLERVPDGVMAKRYWRRRLEAQASTT